MKVEIICVGTELLLGEIVNTNATDIQKVCKEYGHDVYYTTVVGDNPKRIEDCFKLAFNRGCDCIITTGGIGPTEDDLTKEISAKVLGLEMVYNEEEAQKIHDKCSFVANSDYVASTNYKQAYYPKDAIIIDNRIGTANGCVMIKDEKRIINLPGPPKEVRWCIENFLRDYLRVDSVQSIYTKDITTIGIGESNMALILQDIVNRQSDVTIAIYAHEDFNRVRLGNEAYSKQEAMSKIEPIEKEIREILKDYLVDLNEMKNKVKEVKFNVECNFPLDLNFLSIDPDSKYHLSIIREKHPLGDHVVVSMNDHQFVCNLLEDALLNQPKLQSNIINHLYQWIYCN